MIVTLEDWYTPRFTRLLEMSDVHNIDVETAEHLSINQHLLPFFFYRSQNQSFVVPEKDFETVVYARVNHGIWQVACPSASCSSAQHASFADPWFFCAGCHNSVFGNKSVRVVWPDNRDDIERVLNMRPYLSNQNWDVNESVDDLLRENEEIM